MGKSLTMLGCSLVACISLANCSDSTPSQPPQKKNPPPGVLIIDATDYPAPERGAKSYRIGNSTIPAGDFEALKSILKAAREALPKEDPNVPRLIIHADANIASTTIAPVVLAAINIGFDYVDLDGNLPPPTPRKIASDRTWTYPIIVRVRPGLNGRPTSYEMTGDTIVISSEENLCKRLKLEMHQIQLMMQGNGEHGYHRPVQVWPSMQVSEESAIGAYTQVIKAGFKRFVAPRAPYLPDIDIPQPQHPPWPPDCTIFGLPVEAHNVVYICDRSGSLTPMFDMVRRELLRSISKLHPQQDFALLMMAESKPLESDPYGLVPASIGSKLRASVLLHDLTARGTTTAMPCMKRAFELLESTDSNRLGKTVYILSDGDFVDMAGANTYTTKDGKSLTGNDAVIQFLRDHNPDKAVQVNTILLFSQDKEATKVFKQIAAENAGQFKHVSQDD